MSDRDTAIAGVMKVMAECGEKLPARWEAEFWLGSAYTLAELLVDTTDGLSEMEQGVIVGTGGMLLRQAMNEQEASGLLDAFLACRKGGIA